MRVLSFMGAVGLGIFSGVWLVALQERRRQRKALVNINEASPEELVRSLGLEPEIAERIVEQRPYPSKIDLLGRMVVPEEIYVAIKNRISYKAL